MPTMPTITKLPFNSNSPLPQYDSITINEIRLLGLFTIHYYNHPKSRIYLPGTVEISF